MRTRTLRMAIPGVDMIVALAIIAAFGNINRFGEPEKFVSYLGLNPSVRQSEPGPAHHGRIEQLIHFSATVLVTIAIALHRPSRHPCEPQDGR